MVPPPAGPPQQQRSRETLARLLESTISVIAADGLEAATIPRIAKAAGVAPASVYRRFADKESLLRAAFLDVLQRSNSVNAAAVPPALANRTLEWVGAALARTIIAQYRAQPKLMRALIRFAENDDDTEFRTRAMSLVTGNIELIVATLTEQFSADIRHPDVPRALAFIIRVMANVIETRALDDFSLWTQWLPLSDDELVAELQRLFLAYLRA